MFPALFFRYEAEMCKDNQLIVSNIYYAKGVLCMLKMPLYIMMTRYENLSWGFSNKHIVYKI